jgi:hypothetical protein
MAKDKKFEAAYKLERLRRTKIRKAARREKRKQLMKYKPCPRCGRYPSEHDDWDW